MNTTGPNHWTRPPASQRRRWDADAPLEKYEERMPMWQRVIVYALALAVCVGFWAGVMS